ncbi:9147_t:CDS:2 [Funneliformis geosporum]|nr:9147_t:CDS:2 [Funneliformis geosporum]
MLSTILLVNHSHSLQRSPVAYINLANINNEARIRNILDRSVKGEVREWYRATIGAIRGANAGAITGAVASFPNVPLGLAGADIILAQGLDEDWTIAGG